ncbi:uncharacterized protein PgNI_00859 [Pyricularia grisea]|uniref:Uncharacterized protein n=1 Tax=Pyricularia grisea TaxID=148305 RepID=A0A6P8BIS0_PYRGI|nr:uncharacterized protein PgNI_00859 [Pyricularia grisea]TLD16668.1 hypothetical protein PgNI_00859 [Pyricularia grisea]
MDASAYLTQRRSLCSTSLPKGRSLLGYPNDRRMMLCSAVLGGLERPDHMSSQTWEIAASAQSRHACHTQRTRAEEEEGGRTRVTKDKSRLLDTAASPETSFTNGICTRWLLERS